jgi:hypothetical protein
MVGLLSETILASEQVSGKPGQAPDASLTDEEFEVLQRTHPGVRVFR